MIDLRHLPATSARRERRALDSFGGVTHRTQIVELLPKGDDEPRLATMRRFAERDTEAVIRLNRVAMRVAGVDAGPGPWDADLEDIPGNYLNDDGDFLVVESAGQILGMGALRRVDALTGEIKRMRTLPDFQGRGVGRAIGVALIERARQIGYHRLVLDTAAEGSRAAIGLYTSLGFVGTGSALVAGMPSLLFELRLGR